MPAWCLPAELQTPVPRPARITFRARWQLIGISLFFAILIVLPIVLPGPDIWTRVELKWHGVDTSGQVTRLFVEHRKNTLYHVAYRYTPPEAEAGVQPWGALEQFGEGTVTPEDYRALRLGAPLPVIYDPRDPARALPNFHDSVRTDSPARMLALPAILTGGLFVTGCLAISMFFWRCRKERALLAFGAATPATILSEDEYFRRYGRVCDVAYRFVNAAGATVDGVYKDLPSETASRGDSRARQTRQQLFGNPTALYDPRNSARNTLYPPLFAEIVNRS